MRSVPHDGNGAILLRWGAYLEAAERDHAVHHLGHAEAVPEIMKGVVSVIVMNTQLQGGNEAVRDRRALSL